jgi:membrane fusion protein, heavy metal efflux system
MCRTPMPAAHHPLAAAVILGAAALAAGCNRQTWSGWFGAARPQKSTEEQAALPADQVVLTPKAQQVLKLDAQRLYPCDADDPYWRTVPLPGEIVDRPGFSDRGVVAPVTGTVLEIQAMPGDIVKPGQALFALRLVSESLYNTQSELFKATREIELTRDRRKRLAEPEVAGAVGSRVLDLDNQLRRLDASVNAARQELQTRGLTTEQINEAAKGNFVGRVEVRAPARPPQAAPPDGPEAKAAPLTVDDDKAPSFEMQDLKVDLGQQVQAGQTLCLLADHRWLYIQGHGFHDDIPLVARAIKEGYPVEVEFLTPPGGDWPKLRQTFRIQRMGNSLDAATRTFGFYLTLQNEWRTHEVGKRKTLEWRFLPGQQVRLNVRVEKLEDVYVVPAEALVREGAEVFVFEKKGDSFLRRPVRVLYADRRDVVIDHESLPLGTRVVRRGALEINRMLKAQGGQVPAGFHIHPDGSIHMNADEK